MPNNRLLSVLDRGTSMVDAFRVADDVLRQGVQGVSDLVTLPGLINLDFADVRTIMSGAGTALLGIGMGTGDRRAIEAAEKAVASPLLETSMDGARSILLSITGGRDLSLWEVNEAAKAVAEAAHPDANIIFGAMVDDSLEESVWVTVVATGYGEARPRAASRSVPACPRAPAPERLREPAGEPRVAAFPRPPPRARHARVRSAGGEHDGRAALGVVAAGHPPAPGPGRSSCAREATRSTRRLARCSPRLFRAMLAELGAGGYMLVAHPSRSPRSSISSSKRRDAEPIYPSVRSELIPVDVSFGDAVQVFNIGADLVGTYGVAAGVCEASRRFGPHAPDGAGRSGERG